MSFIMRTVCCSDLWLSDALNHHTLLLRYTGESIKKRKERTSELSVKVDSGGPFFSYDKIPLCKMETMGAVNKCPSAVLTNHLSSGTRCHRGIAEALQRSLCVASRSHPSSQLIRLIFTSITAVSHTGFHQSVCVL